MFFFKFFPFWAFIVLKAMFLHSYSEASISTLLQFTFGSSKYFKICLIGISEDSEKPPPTPLHWPTVKKFESEITFFLQNQSNMTINSSPKAFLRIRLTTFLHRKSEEIDNAYIYIYIITSSCIIIIIR